MDRIEILRQIASVEREISILNSKFWDSNTDTDKLDRVKAELFAKECELNRLRFVELMNN